MKLSDFFNKRNKTYTSSNYCLLKIIYLRSGLLSSLQKNAYILSSSRPIALLLIFFFITKCHPVMVFFCLDICFCFEKMEGI